MALHNVQYIAETLIPPLFASLDSTFKEFNAIPHTEETGKIIYTKFSALLQDSNLIKLYTISSKIIFFKTKNPGMCDDEIESMVLYWLFLNRYLLVYNRNHPQLQTRKAFYLHAKEVIYKSQGLDFAEVKTVELYAKINHSNILIPPHFAVDRRYVTVDLGLDDIKL